MPASDALRLSEQDLLAAVSGQVGVPLAPRTFLLPGGIRVGVDGADGDGTDALLSTPTVLVQCAASSRVARSQQRNRLLADAFKLGWLRSVVNSDAQLILALSAEHAPLLAPTTWLLRALRDQRVQIALADETGGLHFSA